MICHIIPRLNPGIREARSNYQFYYQSGEEGYIYPFLSFLYLYAKRGFYFWYIYTTYKIFGFLLNARLLPIIRNFARLKKFVRKGRVIKKKEKERKNHPFLMECRHPDIINFIRHNHLSDINCRSFFILTLLPPSRSSTFIFHPYTPPVRKQLRDVTFLIFIAFILLLLNKSQIPPYSCFQLINFLG